MVKNLPASTEDEFNPLMEDTEKDDNSIQYSCL